MCILEKEQIADANQNIEKHSNKKKFDIFNIMIISDSLFKVHPSVADDIINWLIGLF